MSEDPDFWSDAQKAQGLMRERNRLDAAITTIKVDREAFGRSAADALLARFANGTNEQATIDLGFEIIRRVSA